MMQRLLFTDSPGYQLRYYQREACEAVIERFHTDRSTLVVMATGLGKTQVFCSIAKDWPGNVLVLAHRDELVEQARRRLEDMTGEYVEIEQGPYHANASTRLVVGTIQTIASRLERWPRDHFSLVIADECHHYLARTYRKPMEYFKSAKVLGVTATPDRCDNQALGQMFDSEAYCMGIKDGISAGYLVPIRGATVQVDEIDLTAVKRSGNDLNIGDLDRAMLEAVEGIVCETIRLGGGRQGIAFFPGVRSAQYAAERFNAVDPGSAFCLHGGTDSSERKMLVRRFKAGDYRYLCNCMIATEGFDVPEVSLIIQARPTKSRALYAQMIGRGGRVLAGVVERYADPDAAAVRREGIHSSAKPDMIVLDFVGNAGNHKLMGPLDALGGIYDSDVVQLAKKTSEQEGEADLLGALENAKLELLQLKALAARLDTAKIKSRVRTFDPFATMHLDRNDINLSAMPFGAKPATDAQKRMLEKHYPKALDVSALTKAEASKLITAFFKRQSLGLATPKQVATLARYGVTDINISFDAAMRAMNYISSECGWGKRSKPGIHRIKQLLKGEPNEGRDL